jgi:hypothetical protein
MSSLYEIDLQEEQAFHHSSYGGVVGYYLAVFEVGVQSGAASQR